MIVDEPDLPFINFLIDVVKLGDLLLFPLVVAEHGRSIIKASEFVNERLDQARVLHLAKEELKVDHYLPCLKDQEVRLNILVIQKIEFLEELATTNLGFDTCRRVY